MGKHLLGAFAAENPQRFAALLERSEEVAETLDVLKEIPDGLECDVVARLSSEAADRILGQVPDATVISWLESGPAESGRSMLTRIGPDHAARFIAGIGDRSKRRDLCRLAAYPEDSVGRLMDGVFVSCRATMTVEEALRELRASKVRRDSRTSCSE